MVPDCNFMGTTSYKYLRGNIYQEEGIKLARSATLGRDTVIGQVSPPHSHALDTLLGTQQRSGLINIGVWRRVPRLATTHSSRTR